VKWMVSLIALTVLLGCGGRLQQLAVETMENAQVTLTAATAAGAEETALTAWRTAQEMLTGAETAMEAGDTERAYRLGLRAYLHARIAREIALAIRQEALVQEAQAQLKMSQQRVAEVRLKLATVKAELEALNEL